MFLLPYENIENHEQNNNTKEDFQKYLSTLLNVHVGVHTYVYCTFALRKIKNSNDTIRCARAIKYFNQNIQ